MTVLTGASGTALQVIDVGSLRMLASIVEPGLSIHGWSTDSRFLALRTGDSRMVIWDWKRDSAEGLRASAGTWSNTGSRFAYFSADPSPSDDSGPVSLRIKDLDSGSDSLLTTVEPAFPGPIYWSPDDATLAASHFKDGRWRTQLVDVPRRATIATVTAAYPSGWSPASNMLLLTGNVCAGFDVFTVASGGTALTNHTDSEDTDLDAHWSPDGDRIALVTYRPGQVLLRQLTVDGGQLRELLAAPSDQLSLFDWSPDGAYIAFSYGGGKGICEAVEPERTTVTFP